MTNTDSVPMSDEHREHLRTMHASEWALGATEEMYQQFHDWAHETDFGPDHSHGSQNTEYASGCPHCGGTLEAAPSSAPTTGSWVRCSACLKYWPTQIDRSEAEK